MRLDKHSISNMVTLWFASRANTIAVVFILGMFVLAAVVNN